MMQALLVTVYKNVIGELHKLHIKSWKYYIDECDTTDNCNTKLYDNLINIDDVLSTRVKAGEEINHVIIIVT